jgi:hypothetical protein
MDGALEFFPCDHRSVLKTKCSTSTTVHAKGKCVQHRPVFKHSYPCICMFIMMRDKQRSEKTDSEI